MIAYVKRLHFRGSGIFSEFTCENQTWYVCERAYPTAQGSYLPKVTAGTYVCTRYNSPHLKLQVWRLKDVPPFDGKPVVNIEIHPGNTQFDSEGCFLIGQQLDLVGNPPAVRGSRAAFRDFMLLTNEADELTLVVS